MTASVLKNSLFKVLGIAVIGGFQYSTLTQLSSVHRNISSQNNLVHTEHSSRQNNGFNHVEQSIERLLATKRLPSLGFRNIWANYAFTQFLQYFGDDNARQQTGYGHSADYFSVITHHDPYFRKFYIFLSGSSTLYAGTPEKSVQIMSKGIAGFGEKRPADSYYIWRYKGTDELLFLNDGKSAKESFKMAADWALEVPGEEASTIAKVSQQTANFLEENPDSQLAQITAWGSILTTALDTQTRNKAIGKIRELGGDVILTEDGRAQVTLSTVEASSDNVDI